MHKSVKSILVSLLFSVAVFGQCGISVSAYSSDEFTSRFTEPSRDSDSAEYKYYYSDMNDFTKFGYGIPNCTAYAWGRVYEITGEKPLLSTGNAGKWYIYNINEGIYGYGCVPKQGAVACYDLYDNYNGHVSVVEDVSDDRDIVTVSESQYGAVNFLTYDCKSDSSDHMLSYRFLGYIYTDDFSGRFYGDAFSMKNISEDCFLTASGTSASAGSVSENFRFEPLGNGLYRISSVSDDSVLTYEGMSVSFKNEDTSRNSEWRICSDNDSEYFISPAGNSSVFLSLNEGTPVLSAEDNDTCKWELQRRTGITDLDISDRSYTDTESFGNTLNSGSVQISDIFLSPETDAEVSEPVKTSGYLYADWTNMKTDYTINEIPDLSGIVLYLNEVKISELDVSRMQVSYDFASSGNKLVEVTYDGLTAYYPVTVYDDVVESSLTDDITAYLLNGNGEYNSAFDLNNDNSVDASDLLVSAL